MKHLQSLLFSFGLLTIFASCSGIRNMQVQVMRPARITVPQEIKSIGILNRSIPTNMSAIEGTLTGETPRQDKKLSEECL